MCQNLKPSFQFAVMLVIPLMLVLSCDKVGKTTNFNMEYNSNVVIQDTMQVGVPYDILTASIPTSSQTTFAAKNTNNDLVESIKLTALDISVKNPPGANFGALDSIKLYMSAPGKSEVLLAEKWNILNVATEIQFDNYPTGNFKLYLIKDEILFRMCVYLDNVPSEDLTINLHANFYVEAKETQD